MKNLLVACPLLLLLPACELKGASSSSEADSSIVEQPDTDTDSDSDSSATDSSATEGHTSVTSGDPEPVTTTANPTLPDDDDPANDNCVPAHDGPDSAGVRSSGSESGDPGSTGGDEATGTGEGTGGGDGGTTGTAGDTDTDGDTDTEGACEPLPEQTPVPPDSNCECDVIGESRACNGANGLTGTRFCDTGGWGPCLTEVACTPGTYTVCFFCDEQFGTWTSDCYMQGGVPQDNAEEDCSTPLVLSFDRAPVEYTTLHADFAFTADDRCVARDWPTAATPWLAIDLDRSGSIDGGHELFGSASEISGTTAHAANGFLALASFDSDGDRRITPADARWSELVVWSDGDSDRRSTLWELQPLAAYGVLAIDLAYDMAPSRCDERGNCEGERATFVFDTPDGHRTAGEVIDVRLGCQ